MKTKMYQFKRFNSEWINVHVVLVCQYRVNVLRLDSWEIEETFYVHRKVIGLTDRMCWAGGW
jgi:hypothetical protein